LEGVEVLSSQSNKEEEEEDDTNTHPITHTKGYVTRESTVVEMHDTSRETGLIH
jgi:hypothetical protein